MPSARYQALIELLRTADTLWNSSRVLFSDWDLSPSQFNVLNLLYELPEGLSQIDLSRELLMHRSNLTGLVDRLEERDLVRRQEVPGDRRSYRVVLSGRGRRLMAKILPRYHQASEEVWGELNPERAVELKSIVEALRANAERMAAAIEKTSAGAGQSGDVR